MDRDKVIRIIDELIFEAQKEPTWKAENALRCLKKELLKDQEAVEPKRIDGKRNHFIKCGNCNYDLVTGFQFCPHCGRSVKWE